MGERQKPGSMEAASKSRAGDQETGMEVSGKEDAKAENKEQRDPDELRSDYIDWANEIGKDKNWVEKTFEFDEDGSVRAPKGLYLGSLTELPGGTLPPNLVYVESRLDLKNLASAKTLKIPDGVDYVTLDSLTHAESIEITHDVNWVFLNSLKTVGSLKISANIPWLHLESLTSAEGLELSEGITVDVALSKDYPDVIAAVRKMGGRVDLKGGYLPDLADM